MGPACPISVLLDRCVIDGGGCAVVNGTATAGCTHGEGPASGLGWDGISERGRRGRRAGPGLVRQLDRGGERRACGCRGLHRRPLRPRIGVGLRHGNRSQRLAAA